MRACLMCGEIFLDDNANKMFIAENALKKDVWICANCGWIE
jgi:RNase P subunit RPR2